MSFSQRLEDDMSLLDYLLKSINEIQGRYQRCGTVLLYQGILISLILIDSYGNLA